MMKLQNNANTFRSTPNPKLPSKNKKAHDSMNLIRAPEQVSTNPSKKVISFKTSLIFKNLFTSPFKKLQMS